MSKNRPIRILIVGIGALGGTIATRALSAGIPVWLATGTAKSARKLRLSGLCVSGIGGDATAEAIRVAAIEEYEKADQFDLILLATKAHDALEIAPFLASLLLPGGILLPIQTAVCPRSWAIGSEITLYSEGCLILVRLWLNRACMNSGMPAIYNRRIDRRPQ